MSSQEEDNNTGDVAAQAAKKRRIQRACDMCRRKKIKCDGAEMPNNRCSICVMYKLECTYVEAAKKRRPPKGYVESLETRLEKMEQLLNKLRPNTDFTKELGGSIDNNTHIPERNGESSTAASGRTAHAGPTPSSQPPVASTSCLGAPASQVDSEDLDQSDDEIIAQRNIVQSLRKLSVNPGAMRYHGKSSSLLFIQTALDLKQEYTGTDLPRPIAVDVQSQVHRRRQDFLSSQAWLTSAVKDEQPPHKEFPPPDLFETLVDLYFKQMNDYMPLLHRPTFEQGIKDNLHLRDEGFGSTVLLVCANGARFSDDPRVLLDNNRTAESAGWKWFEQVQMVRKTLLAAPRLYDLQIYALIAGYLQGTSAPQACWTIIGVGIRLAQDVGAHRKKVYSSSPTIEEELWRRAFWVLIAMDRPLSLALGRPCAIQDEDLDIDLATECDDEYWTAADPEKAFKQPPGKPSKIAFFNCFLRLQQILAFAMRTIYSINKSKALLGFVGQQWEQHIVAELDSALNKWIDSVPDHLRWDPTREDLLFLSQSANLYAHYYQLQISVHRPFIPQPRKSSPLAYPSLAICTNAARSCIHVMDVQYKRVGVPTYFSQITLFTAGTVLLLNIWAGKQSGLSTDPVRMMADVHKCMHMLKLLERYWHSAGRLWDMLHELASVGDRSLPPAEPNKKRERDSDSPASFGLSPASSSSHNSEKLSNDLRTFAGMRNTNPISFASVSFAEPMYTSAMPASLSPESQLTPASTQASSEDTNPAFALPLHTDELGRLPFDLTYGIELQDQRPPASSATSAPAPPSQAPSQIQLSSQAPTLASAGAQQLSPAAASALGADFDPRMLTMYNMHAVPGFGEVFTAAMMSGRAPSPSPLTLDVPAAGTDLGVGAGASAVGAASLGAQMSVAAAGLDMGVLGSLPITDDELALTDNTLAMWSNAPTSFEWDDWGTYITNVSEMQQPTESTSAPPLSGPGQ